MAVGAGNENKTIKVSELALMLRREAYAIRVEHGPNPMEVGDDPNGFAVAFAGLGWVRTPEYAVMRAFDNLADRLEGKR